MVNLPKYFIPSKHIQKENVLTVVSTTDYFFVFVFIMILVISTQTYFAYQITSDRFLKLI